MNERSPDNLNAEYMRLIEASEQTNFQYSEIYDEYAEQENLYIERVVPVLASKGLVPEGVDSESINYDSLAAFCMDSDKKVRDFAQKTFVLADMVGVAEVEKQYSAHTVEGPIQEIMQENLGFIIKDNPEYEKWIEAGYELVGDSLPLSDDPKEREFQIKIYPDIADLADSRMRDLVSGIEGARKEIEEALSSVGYHDDLNAVSQHIVANAISTVAVSGGEYLPDSDELHARIIKDKKIGIEPDLLYKLFMRAIEQVKASYS